MSKTVKTLFIIFNILLFLANYIFIVFIPSFLIFGWLPSQFAFSIGSMLLASLVWGLYYNKFFDTQEHIDKRYAE